MPYLNPEVTKEVRKELRKEFKNLKLSVKTRNYSTLEITIKEGDVDFNAEHQTGLNYMTDRLEGKLKEVVERMKEIIEAIKPQKELVLCSDYGSVPNFYIDIELGSWDKPYKLKTA